MLRQAVVEPELQRARREILNKSALSSIFFFDENRIHVTNIHIECSVQIDPFEYLANY